MKLTCDQVICIAAAILIVLSMTRCSSRAGNMSLEKHQASVHNPGAGMMYIDKVDCGKVMRLEDGSSASVAFHCYRVGFIDSLAMARVRDKKEENAGKYFQYDMQNDWIALSNGDTLQPVFFDQVLRHEVHRTEGILVFESVKVPDTLIYHDSFGSWGTRQFIISSSKK